MTPTRFSPARIRPWLAALLAGLTLFGFAGSAQALSPQASLLVDYQSIRPKLLHNDFGVPVYVQSREQGDLLTAEVYGQVDYSLERLKATLAEPSGWCELLSLTLNVKACTFDARPQQQRVTLYMGRKFYQTPDQAYQVNYDFHTVASNSKYFEESLSAADGPLGTHDYLIVLQAVSVPDGTLIHIRSGYRSSTTSRWATSLYLATLGRDKIGFSTVSVDTNGQPVYVGGVRGTIERNTMRHYLALQTLLETRDLPEKERFETRIHRWYALTERYSPQLHELPQEEYLQAKRREHLNQLRLQNASNQ